MAILRKNVIANFAGAACNALLTIALIPLYIRQLGVEPYAIIGLQVTILAVFSVLDLGLSTTLSREIARFRNDRTSSIELLDLVKTLEVIYCLAAIVIVLAVVGLAAPIGDRWVHALTLSRHVIVDAIRLIGLTIGLQFLFMFYTGGLLGLERHDVLNVVMVFWAILRAIGTIVLLLYISKSLTIFFSWQVVAWTGQTITARFAMKRHLPSPDHRPVFHLAALRPVGRFALGMGAVMLFGTLLSQLDKIVLSKIMALEVFGYYSVATTMASSISLAVAPMFASVLPRFSSLIAAGRQDELRVAYHRSAQVLSCIVVPMAVLLAFFSKEILMLWTRNPDVATNVHTAASLLAIGCAVGAVHYLPHALQLAAGWAGLAIAQDLVVIALVTPLLVWAATAYGAVGAASCWIVINFLLLASSIVVMHRRLLPLERQAWLLRDIGLPLIGAVSIAVPARLLAPAGMSLKLSAVWVCASAIAIFAAASAITPYMRQLAAEGLHFVNHARLAKRSRRPSSAER